MCVCVCVCVCLCLCLCLCLCVCLSGLSVLPLDLRDFETVHLTLSRQALNGQDRMQKDRNTKFCLKNIVVKIFLFKAYLHVASSS